MAENNNMMYRTNDFYLSCFLKVKGIKLIKVIKNGKVATFVFDKKGSLDSLITSFYSGNQKVEAIDFINAIRDLKALIYNL